MKINNDSKNMSIFLFEQEKNVNNEKKSDKKSNSFFAGDTLLNKITKNEKMEKAREDAWKIVSDQFKSDLLVDKSLDDIRSRNVELQEQMSKAGESISDISNKQNELKEQYGITDENIDKASEEFKSVYDELEKQKEHFTGIVENAKMEYVGNENAIRDTKLELLKLHGMVDAEKIGDKIIEQASKELMNDLVKESIDKIEEEQKEQEKEAEKLKEKQEEQEERIEAQKENGKTVEQLREEMEEILKANNKGIEDLKQEMSVLEEDLKGLAVNKLI